MIDPGEKDHRLTWHPEPHRRNQQAQIGMRIDYILVNEIFKIQMFSHMQNFYCSDHRPVRVTLSIYAQELPSKLTCRPTHIPWRDEEKVIARLCQLRIDNHPGSDEEIDLE